MAVSGQDNSRTFVATGTVAPVAIAFPWAKATDLVVQRLIAGADSADDGTPEILNSSYSIGGSGRATPPASPTGFLTEIDLIAGRTYRIERKTAVKQAYLPRMGIAGDASAQEHQLDDIVMAQQDAGKSIEDTRVRAMMVDRGVVAPSLSIAGLVDGDILQFSGGVFGRLNRAAFVGKFYAGDATGKMIPASGTGADSALRTDMAAATGWALIGVGGGQSLQDYLVALVNSTALTGATALMGGARTAPHANFAFLAALGWQVTGCRGVGLATMNLDIRDVFEANFGGFIGTSVGWVALDGNDTTGTGSFSQPFATMNKAVTSSFYTIKFKPGRYALADHRYTYTLGTAPKRFLAPYGGVTLAVLGVDISTLTWTANGTYANVYECTLTGTEIPQRILLKDSNDGYGELVELPMAALEGEVLATALAAVNSAGVAWWFDSATRKLYLRYGVTNVETSLKTAIRAVYGSSTRDNRILLYASNSYWEGIEIEGYLSLLEQSGQATPQVWLKNMTFRWSRTDCVLNNGGFYYAQNVRMHSGTADGFKINNGLVRARGVEIGCRISAMGAPGTFDRNQSTAGIVADADLQIFNPISPATLNKNASSDHTGDVIRVNADYARCAGPTVADTAGSYAWNIGCRFGRPQLRATTNVAFGLIAQGAGQRTWNDSCEAVGANGGFNADSTAQMRNFGSYGTASATAGGSVSAFVPT